MNYTIINGNNIDVLKTYPDNYFDSIVTDPPYGISFLGKEWDNNVGTLETYQQCLRVLKPGGHILAFSAARTYHHLAMIIEQAGFEIRDQIMWIYGSGFPKSQDVGRMIQRNIGVEELQQNPNHRTNKNAESLYESGHLKKEIKGDVVCTDPIAKQWEGWGTQLKPAHEPICMGRKPLIGSVYKNVQQWGTGALNIDATRIQIEGKDTRSGGSDGWDRVEFGEAEPNKYTGDGYVPNQQGRFPANIIHDGSDEVTELFPLSKHDSHWPDTKVTGYGEFGGGKGEYLGAGPTEDCEGKTTARFFKEIKPEGRFPANVIHDGSDEVTELFPYTISGARKPEYNIKGLEDGSKREIFGSEANSGKYNVQPFDYAEKDEGSASRFFKEIKPEGRFPANIIMDEQAGEILDEQAPSVGNMFNAKRTKDSNTGTGASLTREKHEGEDNGIYDGLSGASKFFYCPKVSKKERGPDNNHPTVKPIELMKYLIKLVTPNNGKVLDPFNGSGSTGIAAVSLGHEYVGIELDPKYVEISNKRIEAYNKDTTTFNKLFEEQ